jgi:hypothetical protein
MLNQWQYILWMEDYAALRMIAMAIFTTMVLKAEKEVPPPPKVKAKALKANKAMLKGVNCHSQTHTHTHNLFIDLSLSQDTVALEQPKYPQKNAPGETSLTAMSSSNSP